jgi:glycosyltransferase involved in cell wall biosynthesis
MTNLSLLPSVVRVAIIPAFNEEKRIAGSVRDSQTYVDLVVVVNDCSSDRTAQNAAEAGAIVLDHPVNRGQGAAIQTGTEFALKYLHATHIVHFDADNQMMGSEIPKLLGPLLDGKADIILGSRFLGEAHNIPPLRRMTLKLGLLFTRWVSGIQLTDTHNGFRALNSRAASAIVITLDRMAHASEILDQIISKKLRYMEVPVTIRYTEETLAKGQSSVGALRILKDFLGQKFFWN